jgi:hypothetical protein
VFRKHKGSLEQSLVVLVVQSSQNGCDCGTILDNALAWADVLLLLRTTHNPSAVRLINEEASYKLKKPGCLLEGILDCDMDTSSCLALGLWVKGSLVQVRGGGEEDTNAIRITTRPGITNVNEELASERNLNFFKICYKGRPFGSPVLLMTNSVPGVTSRSTLQGSCVQLSFRKIFWNRRLVAKLSS